MNAVVGAVLTSFVSTLERVLVEVGEEEAQKAIDWLEAELALVRKHQNLPQSDEQGWLVDSLQREVVPQQK